jgi:DNA-binding NarL/FixJ family response regulator
MAGYKIVLADEHKMFLEGVKTFLESNTTIQLEIAAMFNSGKDLIDYIGKKNVNIIISEINFPGIEPDELIQEIKTANKETKLIVLSAYGDIKLVKSCFKSGADGYLLKTSNSGSLITCINTVMQDRIFLGENLKVAPEINDISIESETEKKKFPIDRFLVRQNLTNRELEILKLICEGHSNKAIGAELFISEHTASVHRKHILKKIGAGSSQELIEFVAQFEIL